MSEPKPSMETLELASDRFWSKVEPEPNSGCLLWVGATNQGGYGVMGLGTRRQGNVLAHRFSYLLQRGGIPLGLEPDHLCRVRRCVNAWHPDLVTRRVNSTRGHTFTADDVRSDGRRQCRKCRNMLRGA